MLDVPATLGRYLDELVAALRGFDLVGAYAVGSIALGGYEEGRSDVDVYAVVERPFAESDQARLLAEVAGLDVPARRLELVVYSRDEAASPNPRFELNSGDPDESTHWFVLDRAIAQEHALVLEGPPWSDLFSPVEREQVLRALAQSLEWYERHEPDRAGKAAARALAWLETGDWLAKPAAELWLSSRVREQLEAAR